ncbi:MAG: glycosyltransferase family 4 protein [bacterium]
MFSREKLKIGFVIHGLSMGGAEKFMIYLVNKLKEDGHMPIIISLSTDKTLIHELNKDVPVVTILRKHKFDFTIVYRIRKVILDNHLEQVFCINMFSFFLTRIGLLYNRSIKFYLSLHSTVPVSFKNHLANHIYFGLVQQRDHVIYICNNQQGYLKKKYLIRAHTDQVIYNGIDTDYFDPSLFSQFDTLRFRRQFGIAPADLVILKVARLRVEKGHSDAIRALGILHKQYGVKAHLLFVGNGDRPFIKSLTELSREFDIEEYIHFSGIQSDVRKFYLSSTIFTLTSHSIETFSLAALEAMAFSLPCSLTNIGGANEMIYEEINGCLSEPNNPLSIAESWNKLLTTSFNRKSIRDIVLNNFTSDIMLQQYINLFEKEKTNYN